MRAAERCWTFVQKAVLAAQEAQRDNSHPGHNDFDRMAINAALVHLERALEELRCFDPARRERA
jgi:hypothetical protein